MCVCVRERVCVCVCVFVAMSHTLSTRAHTHTYTHTQPRTQMSRPRQIIIDKDTASHYRTKWTAAEPQVAAAVAQRLLNA